MTRQAAVFWDLDNTYWTVQGFYGNADENTVKTVEKVWELYKDDTIRVFRAYADYDKIRNVQTTIQKKRVTPKHVFSSNSEENRKNAGDIELSLDALETVFKCPDIELYVIISADKDMIPLMNRLKYFGKQVNLIYLEASIAEDKLILDFADEKTSIEFLLELAPSDAKKELTSEELEKYVPAVHEVVNNFYMRNVEKPEIFLGQSLFVKEMQQKKKLPGIIASQLLEYCLKNRRLLLVDHIDGKYKKVIVPKE